jgi:hypothetical protein
MVRSASIRAALLCYLIIFITLSAVGWGIEIAGRAEVVDVSTDYSALFHPFEDFHDGAAFGDFADMADRTVHLSAGSLRRPGAVSFPYPPASAFLMKLLNHGYARGAVAYLVCFAFIATLAVFLVARRLGRAQPLTWVVLFVTVLLGSPQIFCANRGNLEIFSSAFAAGGLALFLGDYAWIAAVSIGLAMCVKPFPAVLLLLFVWRKQWAHVALALGVCLTVSVTALHFLGPSVGAAGKIIAACWGDFFQQQVLVLNILPELKTDHALMDAVKVVLWRVLGDDSLDLKLTDSDLPVWARLDLWARFFEIFAVCASICVAWFFRSKPVLNQIFALVLLMLLLPYISAEYTLMLLYLPCTVLLVQFSRNEGVKSPGMGIAVAVLLALLFAPLNVSGIYEGAVKTLVLLALFCFISVVPMRVTTQERSSESFAPATY